MLTSSFRHLIEELCRGGKYELAQRDWEVLEAEASRGSEYTGQIRPVMAGMMRGYLHLAASGHAFVPEEQIAERHGRSLQVNYPEATPAFLRFATTYWTYKIWLEDHGREIEGAPIGAALLASIEEQLGPVFFPTPGPAMIKPEHRAAKQREILAQFEVPIDVEEFIAGNPILIRDRQRESSGCLGVFF